MKLFFNTSFLFFLLQSVAFSQTNFSVSGYVRDAENGEELIGVTVYDPVSQKGVVTNVYGFYSLALPQGTNTLRFSYLGYQTLDETFELTESKSLNINLKVEVTELQDVVITAEAEDANVTQIDMSKNSLNMTQVKRLPALFGEPDIIKTIQMLPGVVTAGEGTSAFFVRGGSADQNLIQIDEAPVYDPSHLFGLFSVFNSDVIKDSELYKGGIPSRYGGRLSSILDVRTKDGNNQEFEGSASIGSIASKIMLEGPIAKDKSSYIFSARRSYVDVFLKAAGEENLVHFYDINAKVNLRKDNKNRFFAAFYLGRDVFRFEDIFSFGWGNRTATFRWNHLFNDKLFSNTSIIASNFDYQLGLNDEPQGFDWTSDLKEFSIKQDMEWFINPDNRLEFGLHSTYRIFSPGTITPTGDSSFFDGLALDKIFAFDHAAYVEMQNKISTKLDLRYGMRVSLFQNVGPGTVYYYADPQENVDIERTGSDEFGRLQTIQNYFNWEPRFSARWLLDRKSSLKISYNRMVQNTHLIASGTVPLPFNTWQPSSFYLRPQVADQVAGGYFRNFRGNSVEFSLEGYYKNMEDVTDFADNAQLFFNEDLPVEFRQGNSYSYGIESMLQKKKGLLTGFVSYTYSKTMREIPDVNQGNPFPANHDRRHSFNMIGTYEFSDYLIFGGSFTYGSGRPLTIPSGSYTIDGRYVADYYTTRNGYRLPPFHRLDLSVTFMPKKNETRKIDSRWVLSIYNVYNRKNPFTIFTQQVEDSEGNPTDQKEARMIYLFPILPSITYSIDF